MPSVTGPDGRKLRFPDGTSQEEVMAVLQQQYPDAFRGAPAAAPGPVAAPTPAPAAGSPPPGPAGTPPGMVAAPPPGASPEPAPAAPAWGEGNPEYDAMLADLRRQEVDGMPWYSKLAAGAGQSVDSNIRGVRQLWNMATNDQEELAALNEEEKEARRLNEPLLDSGWGRTGQIAGHLAQLAVPGGAVSKGAKALTAGTSRAAQLATVIGAEAGLGAGLGAAQPTIEGESRGDNAAIGAALGGGARVVPGLLGAAGTAVGAKTGISPYAAALAAAARKYSGELDPAKEAVRRAAGERIGEITASVQIPLKKVASELDSIARAYGRDLPDSVRAQLHSLAALGRQGAKLKGEVAQEMRTAVAREASERGGVAQSGLEKIMRLIDRSVDAELPKARARVLRQARNEYRSGLGQPSMGTLAPTVTAFGTAQNSPGPQ